MTGEPTDLTALERAIASGAFSYGDDDQAPDRPSAAEKSEPDTEAAVAAELDAEPAEQDAEPALAAEHDDGDGTEERDDRPTGLARAWHALVAWRLLPVALLVITVLLAGLGAVMLIRAHADQSDGPMANQALVSTGDTQEAVSQVSTALNQILSYDMANPKPAQEAAKRWLVGDAPAQYQTLVTALGKAADGQQLTMVAKVSTAGVLSLHDGTAQLLVFLDQQSKRASDQSSSVSAAQVQVTAMRTPDGWRISEIVPL